MFLTDRVREYLKYKGISQQKFYKITGLSNGSLSAKNIRSDNLEIIISKFEELNLYWLLTGKGSMLKEAAASQPEEKPSSEVFDRLERYVAENALLKKEIEELKARLNDK